jgi:membrane protein
VPLKDRITAWVERVRKRRPSIDHALRMQEHYSEVGGGQQAGAVTYFAFLSVFPILAIAFYVVGQVSQVLTGADDDLVTAINGVLPGIIGDSANQISVEDIERAATTVGLIGLLGLLYAGLGWLSAMRSALGVIFEQDPKEHPNFVVGKLRDLVTLAVLGVVLLLSVAVAGFVTGFSDVVLDWLDVDDELGWLVTLIGRVIGFGANMLLFYLIFKLLARPDTPSRSLWSGALLGAVAFEALKALSFLLLASTEGNPAFQAFGIALILLVWINYTSRGTLYAAAWAHTTAAARGIRDQAAFERAKMQELTRVDLHEAPAPQPAGRGRVAKSFAAGGATALALVAVARRNKIRTK